MNLELTEDQRLLMQSVDAILPREFDFHRRRREDSARSRWALFAEMGWLGQPVGERWGGLGGAPMETGLLQHAFGRHLVTEPFHACMVRAARLLERLGSEAQCRHWLPRTIEGSARLALAHEEAGADDPYQAPTMRARRQSDGWRLAGRKTLAVGLPGAQAVLVSAALAEGGLRVFLLELPQPGLGLRVGRTVDGFAAADLWCTDLALPAQALVGADIDAQPVVDRILAEAEVAACWDACGAATAAYEQTVAHARQRVQFGKPLADFQVVQHRLAEMAVCCTEARAACELASLRLAGADPDAVALAAMAKSKVGRCAEAVAKEAVQLHGAIGTTDELPVSAWFRRIAAFNVRGGSPETHARLLGQHSLAGARWRVSQTLPEQAGAA